MSNKFLNEDKVHANITALQLLGRMWPYCRRHLFLFWSVVIAILGVAIASRLQPAIIGYTIDHGIQTQDLALVKKMALIYLGVQVFYTLLQFYYNYLFQIFGNRVLFYIRQDLFRHMERLPIQYFDKTPVGRIVTRLTNDVSTLAEVFTDGVVSIFVQFVILCSIIISMISISWKLGLVVLFSTPIFIWASLKINNQIRIIYRESKKKLSEINSFVSENLSGIKVVQLYNRIPKNRKRFQLLSDDYKTLTLSSIKTYALLQPVMNLFSATTVGLSLYFGGMFHDHEGLAIGSLVAFILHVQDFLHPLREILEKYQQFQNSLTSGERVFHLLDEKAEDLNSTAEPSKGHVRGLVEIKDLNFQYASHLPFVLKSLNLTIQPGTRLAIVGRTGSGKSTLISLLQKFYSAPADSIFIDGRKIESLSLFELRRKVGVVQQDNYIFKGSIASNIRLALDYITDAEVQKACDIIGYADILKSSHRDIHSPVEERGSNLSVGERQLIAFARILVFKPEILILDEATANIDSQNEVYIQKAMEKISEGRTSIIIAHRLSTIEKCDQILLLKKGLIIEAGSYSELMKQKGEFYQLAVAGVKSMDITSDAEVGTADP